jgi:hypothetical protein
MKTYWIFPRKLIPKLAQRQVSNREVAYFILGNLLFSSAIYYGSFTWGNPPWTLLSWAECLLVVFVTVVGMVKCYDAAGGDENDRFAADFSCLSLPVWLWTTIGVWLTYWVVIYLFRFSVIRLSVDDYQFSKNLIDIGGSFFWLWTVIAIVASQVIYFSWLSKSLRSLAEQRLLADLSSLE